MRWGGHCRRVGLSIISSDADVDRDLRVSAGDGTNRQGVPEPGRNIGVSGQNTATSDVTGRLAAFWPASAVQKVLSMWMQTPFLGQFSAAEREQSGVAADNHSDSNNNTIS